MTSHALTASAPVSSLLWRQRALYLWSAVFVAGNILLPGLCHAAKLDGRVFLPLYLFTLVGTLAFGWRVGVLTATVSPLISHLLFTMPEAAALPPIMVKSLLLVALATTLTRRITLTPLALVLAVVGTQALGSLADCLREGTLAPLTQGVPAAWPGMLCQVLVAWAVLFLMAKNAKHSA